MRPRSAAVTAAAIAVFAVAGGLAGVPGATAAPASPAPAAGAPADSTVVTLMTGDVVRLDTYAGGVQRAVVLHAANPRGGIHTFTSGGDVYVEPASAARPLASGLLDEQLFNVSALVRQGYGDEARPSLPLIVGYRGDAALAPRVAPAGSRTEANLGSANALAVSEDKSQATTFWASVTGAATGTGGIDKVWLDAKVRATLDRSVPQIGAPSAWASGYDGTGVDIAVLDSGIDATHPDFAGRIDQAQDFTGGGDTVDRLGHGTHVASTAAGTGAASDGRYRGVAPAAHLMVGKVLGDDGSGMESWVIAGMQWAASHGADVVNLSLGGPVTKGDDPLSQAVNELTAQYHTLFVVAAGNDSPGVPGTWDVTAPGAAASALTVGAVTKSDAMWSGSRYGLMGDAGIKPDLVAPGANITAAGIDGRPYQSMTGTSMAAPHVAGSVALLLQEHPTWGPEQLKAALTATAQPLADVSVFRAGAGRVDVGKATRQHVYVDQGVLDLGYFARPFDPAALHPTRTLTYTNDSDQPVTLHLASTLGPAAVSPSTLDIQAGGTGRATVTLDAQTPAAGEYSGRITATGDADGVEVDTALGFYKQDDTVDVTFRAVDRDGKPATARLRVAPYQKVDPRYYADNIYLDPEQTEWTLRLPEGDYNLFGLIDTPDASGRWMAQSSVVGNAKLSVHAPNFTVTLDARTAVPLSLQTPKESTPHYLTLEWSRGAPGNPAATEDNWYWDQTDGEPTEVSLAPTGKVDDAPFSVITSWDAGLPMLETRLDGKTVDATVAGGPDIDGRYRYPVVDADADAATVRGAVALIRERPGVSYDDQAAAAAKAGAAVVALYSAQPGVFYPLVNSPVPVIALDRADGQRLRALADGHHAPQLELTGTPRTPYAYDVSFVEKQRVGADLAYRVRDKDLAEVRTQVFTSGAGEHGWLLHQDTYAGCDCAGQPVIDRVPSTGYTRTEYVTADRDLTDYAAWMFQVGSGTDILYPRNGVAYQPGAHTTRDLLKAPFSPGVANGGNGAQLVSSRTGDQLRYAIAGLTDSAGDWTRLPIGATASSTLYLGDKPLYSSAWGLSGAAAVPAGSAQYRLVTDLDQDGSAVALTTHAHTEWTFPSSSPADGATETLPITDLDYTDVVDSLTGHSALDLTNTAPRSRQVSLRITATHQNGSTAPAVDQVAVQVSYDDGATWQPATTRSTGHGTFEATYRHPAAGQYVSLRVIATDPAGGREDQTLIRAYRLG